MNTLNMLKYFVFSILLFEIRVESLFKPPPCKNGTEYDYENNPDCHHFPSSQHDVLVIIKKHTGTGEIHNTTTKDGYILTIFRIPRNDSKGVVLFAHGLPFDAKSWVSQPSDSPAFLFWKAGYDVWLGNFRGNYYTKNHTTLKPDQEKFWNFTFHEMGYYDVNATIDYVKKVTNVPKIIYIAYSMGSTAGLVYASLRSEDAVNSVEMMALTAPACYLAHTKTPTIVLYALPSYLLHSGLYKVKGQYSFVERDAMYTQPIKGGTRLKKLNDYGLDLEKPAIEMDMGQYLSPGSLRTFDHFIQLTKPHADFQWYDYGKEQNVKVYGTVRPPLYPLENVKIPVLLVHSSADLTVVPEDVDITYGRLPKESRLGKIQVNGFTHSRIVFGRNKNAKIFSKILDEVEKKILSKGKK